MGLGLGFEHQGVIPHVEQPAHQVVALEPHETHLVAGLGVRARARARVRVGLTWWRPWLGEVRLRLGVSVRAGVRVRVGIAWWTP